MLFNWIAFILIINTIVQITNAAVLKSKNKNGKSKEPWELIEALRATNMRSFNGTWLTDNELYYTASDRSIHKYNAASARDSIFVPSAILALYGSGSSFKVSPDNKMILIRYDVEVIFRHSSIAKYDVFDLEATTIVHIHGNKKLQHCEWAPTLNRLAFVYENNVYIHFEDRSEIQITQDGVSGIIYNGIPDWVYEEEVLSTDSALWWSPDSMRVAVGNFNDNKVGTFNYALYGNAEDPSYQYPMEENLKYPKPGTPNPIVELRVFNLLESREERFTYLNIEAPINIVSDDHILQDVVWTDTENLLVLWLNRRQNLGTFQSCSTLAAQCHEVKRFEEPKGWIKISSPMCQASGESCVFTYWIGNWFQIWKLDLKTGNNLWKSRGNFTVTSLHGYDEINDIVYYEATLPGQPYVNHVFKNAQCLTCNLYDLENRACRNALAAFSKNFSYYSVNCNGPGPRYSRIFETKTNKLVKDWEANLAYREMISSKLLPEERYLNVTLADGSIAVVRLKLPPNLDQNKKYAMIVNVYGGPDSVRVTSSFSVGFEGYLTTARNVIYAQIDGRGTGNKGKDFLFSINNDLGHYEIDDQIYVTQYLQNNLPFVDKERTGIWGWSYGGYVTAKTLANDVDRVFQCGISVAPVTSWIYYDSIYTERYMGLPTKTDNLRNYEDSSVFKRVNNFKYHDFLLIHGSGDDNVHYQQSLALAKVLQRNDILFEQMTYVDENHSIGNFQPHLYHTMEHFWNTYLSLDMDEVE